DLRDDSGHPAVAHRPVAVVDLRGDSGHPAAGHCPVEDPLDLRVRAHAAADSWTRASNADLSTPASARARGTVPTSACRIPSRTCAGRRSFLRVTDAKPRSRASLPVAPMVGRRSDGVLERARPAGTDTPTVLRLCSN